MEPLISHLTLVRENRSFINQQHDLVDVMFLVISAIMAGAEGWTDIETYGLMKKDWLMKYRPFNNGIPRRQTIAKILQSIDKESLVAALLSWVNERRSHTGKPIIALDGKVLRGAYRGDHKKALQLVTAYDVENGLVLTQEKTADKKGEIAVVRNILNSLNIKGAVITVDALHCQRETLKKISDKRGHVVVQVKGNQPKLQTFVRERFQAVFDAGKEKVVTESKHVAHGRIEERFAFQLKANLPSELAEKWPTIRSIVAIERHRTIKGKGSVDTSYYVSSLSPKHKLLSYYIRQHWRIENSQHYILDVVFKEDSSRIVMDDAVENMAFFRRVVMGMIKLNPYPAPSQRQKLKRASWGDDYRAEIIFD